MYMEEQIDLKAGFKNPWMCLSARSGARKHSQWPGLAES